LKILPDHNLDRRLKRHLAEYEVRTVQEQHWADVLNGDLLDLAEEQGFQVLVTADSNLRKQQNFSRRHIAVIVLRSHNNRLVTHMEMLPQLFDALSKIHPGELVEVFHSKSPGGGQAK
jgi:hypothetical protein